jgi:ubiquinone/menaquinone biosynthesis C-methylase UbiE
MKKMKEFYENKYKNGVWSHPFHPSEMVKFDVTKKMLEIFQDDSVLELGCGNGRYLFQFSKMSGKIIGVDISKTAIKIARSNLLKKTLRPNFIIADITQIPFHNNSLDKIYFIDVLEHIPDDIKVMKETNRVLKKSGKTLFYVPCRNPFSLGWIISKLTGTYPWYPMDKEAGHVHRYTTKEIKKIIKNAKFNMIQIKYFDHFMSTLFELSLSYVKKRLFKKHETSNEYESRFSFLLKVIEFIERTEMNLLGNRTNAAGVFILCSK